MNFYHTIANEAMRGNFSFFILIEGENMRNVTIEQLPQITGEEGIWVQ